MNVKYSFGSISTNPIHFNFVKINFRKKRAFAYWEFYGWDFAKNNPGDKRNYNGKDWFGTGIGFNFLKADGNASNNNETQNN